MKLSLRLSTDMMLQTILPRRAMQSQFTLDEIEICKTIIKDMRERNKPVYAVSEQESKNSVLLSLIGKLEPDWCTSQYADDRLYAIFMSNTQQAAILSCFNESSDDTDESSDGAGAKPNYIAKVGEFVGGFFKGLIS